MGRRQLARLDIDPYQRALLERGVNRWHRHQVPDRRMEQAMGYSGAVGVMLMDKLAGVCERSEERFTEVRTDLGRVEQDVVRGRRWSAEAQEEITSLENRVRGLEAEKALMRGDIVRMREEMDALIRLNADMVAGINQIRVALVHNWANPIVVEDNEPAQEVEIVDDSEVEVEGEGEDEEEIVVPPVLGRRRDLGEGLLVEIVEDPAPPYEGHKVVDDRVLGSYLTT